MLFLLRGAEHVREGRVTRLGKNRVCDSIEADWEEKERGTLEQGVGEKR